MGVYEDWLTDGAPGGRGRNCSFLAFDHFSALEIIALLQTPQDAMLMNDSKETQMISTDTYSKKTATAVKQKTLLSNKSSQREPKQTQQWKTSLVEMNQNYPWNGFKPRPLHFELNGRFISV